MSRVRTKICGITSVADGLAAVAAGADAVGLVFYPASARSVSPATAASIARALPAFVARVALFLDADAATIERVLADVEIDLLQFHGREAPDFCRQFGRPYIKTVPMGEPDIELTQWAADYHDARALLLDANRAGEAGGQGAQFAWKQDLAATNLPIIIAGGLDPDNVAAAVSRFSPYAVDVSSGVESAPGIKDNAKMHAFVRAALNTGC
ncbi:MAG: phosphoribosylanthranilate isomerase [Salinisphaera sp.]|jgi:phosphoribosylanthranilate isomerase|nr:phosphoribosylanthranilate isomerase [Salinisphaera sp.]